MPLLPSKVDEDYHDGHRKRVALASLSLPLCPERSESAGQTRRALHCGEDADKGAQILRVSERADDKNRTEVRRALLEALLKVSPSCILSGACVRLPMKQSMPPNDHS